MRTEQILFWLAVGLYGASTFAYILGALARSASPRRRPASSRTSRASACGGSFRA